MSELLDAAIEEIDRVLIGNKDRHTEEVYLKNAIRYIREYDSQPQLNENQQIVMEFLKVRTSHSNFADAIYQLESSENWLEPEENYDIAYEALNNKERLQVIKVACQWALEQEEE